MIALARNPAIAKRDAWNDQHLPGTFVRVWQSLPKGLWIVAPTSSAAFIHGRGVAVYVVGCSAPVYLSNLAPVEPAALQMLLGADPAAACNEALAASARDYHRQVNQRARERGLSQLPVGDRGDA